MATEEDEAVLGSLNATLARKKAEKYDPELERDIRSWLSSFMDTSEAANESVPLQETLKDGAILCELLNKLAPGAVKRVNRSGLAFKQMENISNYLAACGRLGLSEGDRFQTIDLFEDKDMLAVLTHLRVLKLLAERNKNVLSHLLPAAGAAGSKSSSPAPSKRSSWSFKNPPLKKESAEASPTVARNRAGSQLQGPQGAADVSSLEDDVKTKEEFKYSPELEQGAKVWIRALLGDESLFSSGSFGAGLKSGVVLLQVMNTLVPGSVSKINQSKFGYAQMENIGNYLKACVSQLGLKKTDLFDTPDLYDEKAMNLVISHIHVLAHHVEKRADYSGPKIGNTSQVRTLYSASLGETNLDDIIGSEKSEEEEVSLSEVEQELVDWVNSWLERQPGHTRSIKKLACRGIQSGVALLKLCEALTKCEVGPYEEKPTILWHCMQNASLIRRFIFQQTFIAVETRPQDIILGNVSKIIDLLSFLRDKFDIDYLFLKLLNEGQETKLSLQDVDKRMGGSKRSAPVTPERSDSEAFSDDEDDDEEDEGAEERKRREAEIIALREEAEKARKEEERARAERERLVEERKKREEEERLAAEREEQEELARVERLEIERLEAELRAKDEEEMRQREEEEERERQEAMKRQEAAEAAAAKEREEEEHKRAAAAREEAERKAQAEAQRKATEEAEKARLEALRRKREEEEKAEKELAERLDKERQERIRKALEEAERLERERAEKELQEQRALAAQKAKEEADRKAKEESECRARAEAERTARAEAAAKAKEEAERKAREEAERQAREEAERKAREEAERKAKEAAERKAKEEAECRAKEAAERKAREEAERIERERLERERKRLEEEEEQLAKQRKKEAEERERREAERKAREEAARIEAERKAREAAQRAKEAKQEEEREAARQEAERLVCEEEERQRKAKEQAEKRERAEAERRAREEAELKARQEALRKAREEAERKVKEEAERKAREEQELKARQEAERKAKAEAQQKAREEAERKAKVEAERKAKAEAERKAKAEAERKAREEAERKAREEEERKAKEEAERRVREEAERKAKEEAERKAKAEAERIMQERIRKAKEEARKKEEERYAKEAAARKEKELEERKKRLAAAEKEERELLQRMKEAAEKKKREEEEKARAEAERLRLAEEQEKAREEAARQALEEEKRQKEEEAARKQKEKEEKIAKVKAERKAQEERIAALRKMAMEKAKERAAQREAKEKHRKEEERLAEEARAAELAEEERNKRAKAAAGLQKLEELEKKQAAEAKRRAARKERRDARQHQDGTAAEASSDILPPAAVANRSERVQSMWVNKNIERAATPDKRRSLVLQNDGTKERIIRAQNTVRKRVAMELLETEKNYLKNMQQVIKLLVGPVLNASKQGMRIMKDSEFFSCFANLPQITDHHASFCAKLTERIEENWSDEVTVGDIFIEASAAGVFEDYKPYLINYSVAIVAVQSMVQKYERFKHIVDFFERAQLQGSKLNLESFLIMPVQRMPRYILLMRDMLKYTHAHHPDKVLLEKALEAVSATMANHNKEIDPKASDHAHKLLAVAGSIMNVDVLQQEKGISGGGLIIPKRRWIKEGELSIKFKLKKGSKGMRPGTISCKSLGIDTGNKKPKTYCFLFNDMLIHCEQIPQHKGQTGKEQERPFVFTAALPLVEVTEVETDSKDSRSFSVTLINNSRWIFKADSKESRDTWEALVREQVAAVNA